jgi:hypothetical protein
MAMIEEVSSTILRHKLGDVEDTFNHGLKLYRFEFFLGSTGIGLATLAGWQWLRGFGKSVSARLPL